MMRVAVLGDIHDNWLALEHVLADVAAEQADLLITHRRVDYDRMAAVQDMRAAYREDPGDRTWLERQLYRDGFNAYPDWVTPFQRVTWRRPATTHHDKT